MLGRALVLSLCPNTMQKNGMTSTALFLHRAINIRGHMADTPDLLMHNIKQIKRKCLSSDKYCHSKSLYMQSGTRSGTSFNMK